MPQFEIIKVLSERKLIPTELQIGFPPAAIQTELWISYS